MRWAVVSRVVDVSLPEVIHVILLHIRCLYHVDVARH